MMITFHDFPPNATRGAMKSFNVIPGIHCSLDPALVSYYYVFFCVVLLYIRDRAWREMSNDV